MRLSVDMNMKFGPGPPNYPLPAVRDHSPPTMLVESGHETGVMLGGEVKK